MFPSNEQIDRAIAEAERQQSEQQFFRMIFDTMRERRAGIGDALASSREAVEHIGEAYALVGQEDETTTAAVLAEFDEFAAKYRRLIEKARELVALADAQPEKGSEISEHVRHDHDFTCPACGAKPGARHTY